MFQPRNRQSFKERGKAAAGLGPRQFHHAHPVLGALQARRRGMQNSSILTGVQMSPFPLRLMIVERAEGAAFGTSPLDRKSTRLNSSHGYISYAVFCLKKKKKIMINNHPTHSTSPSL